MRGPPFSVLSYTICVKDSGGILWTVQLMATREGLMRHMSLSSRLPLSIDPIRLSRFIQYTLYILKDNQYTFWMQKKFLEHNM